MYICLSSLSFEVYTNCFFKILAAGLSGLYSSLPTALDINHDDWYCINKDMLTDSKEINNFVEALRFCCEVMKVSAALFTLKVVYTEWLFLFLNQSLWINSNVAILGYQAHFHCHVHLFFKFAHV